MKHESTTQSVKIQIPQKESIEMEIPIPSYYALISKVDNVAYLTLKVCSKEKFVIVTNKDISINNVATTLHIWLQDSNYKPCEPEIFYQYLAKITSEINQIAGIEYLPLKHELTDEGYAQIKYDEGRELINEDRRERENDRKDEITHNPNY